MLRLLGRQVVAARGDYVTVLIITW
uniref:Uncharacterized protein n=1 Tax=Arundo donax TaxID=35708 RepID=A0A0A8YES0_ARUDO